MLTVARKNDNFHNFSIFHRALGPVFLNYYIEQPKSLYDQKVNEKHQTQTGTLNELS